MRIRSKGMLEKSVVRFKDYNPDGSFYFDYGDEISESKANGTFQTTQDVLIPGYRKRSAQGEVFMNPLSIAKTRRETSNSSFVWGPHPGWGRRDMTGTAACHWSVPPIRPPWFQQRIEDAMARTLLQAHSRVAENDFMALVTVAEAAKTARTIARPFGQARDLISRIADRKLALVKRGLTLVAAFSSAWMEYRLGWRPILHDIEGIKEAYINNLVSQDKKVRVVARAADRNIVWDLPNSVSDQAQPHVTNVRMRANYSHRAKVSSGILYELVDEGLESATARRMGLRLADVPASIWELVPHSWVVDRFIDVGTWLNAIQPKPGVNILGSWTTVLDYQLNFHEIVEAKIHIGNNPVTDFVQSGGTYLEEIQSVVRTPNPSIPPVPTVNYRDLNLSQQLDHVALITSRLLGLKTRS